MGSPPYMSPEQVLGKEVDARTDLYSTGAVLYELATGRRPFGNLRGGELADAILHKAPERPRAVNASVPPGLESVILKALEKDPALRHQTAGDLLADLERLSRDGTAHARRRPWRRLVAALALVALPPEPGSFGLPRRHGSSRFARSRSASRRSPTRTGRRTAAVSTTRTGRGTSRTTGRCRSRVASRPRFPSPTRYGSVLGYVRHQSSLLVSGFGPEEPSADGPPLYLVTVPTWTARRSASSTPGSPRSRRTSGSWRSRTAREGAASGSPASMAAGFARSSSWPTRLSSWRGRPMAGAFASRQRALPVTRTSPGPGRRPWPASHRGRSGRAPRDSGRGMAGPSSWRGARADGTSPRGHGISPPATISGPSRRDPGRPGGRATRSRSRLDP